MNEVRVASWNELQDALFADAWVEELLRFRSRCAYRGLSDAEYRLETTLMRMGPDCARLEKHLLRNFRKYAHRRVVERDSIWHRLSVISDPVVALDDWLASHPGIWTRIRIQAELKWEIRDKLDQSNITERVLFPGLEGLTAWLKRHYSRRA